MIQRGGIGDTEESHRPISACTWTGNKFYAVFDGDRDQRSRYLVVEGGPTNGDLDDPWVSVAMTSATCSCAHSADPCWPRTS